MKISFISCVVVVVSFCVVSCSNNKREPLKDLEKSKGDVYYGGSFSYNEVDNFRSLYPLNVTDVVSARLLTQVYEGLVTLSMQDMSVVPAIAESWEVDSNATTYTFRIRKGVKFHDDDCFKGGKGREVTAQDFKYCFTKLCEPATNNAGFDGTFKDRVKGATAYFESVKAGKPLTEGVSGIEVIDANTLRITLETPYSAFPYILTTPFTYAFPKEAVEKYGEKMRLKCVGTGPFIIKGEVNEKEAIILNKNPNYWGNDAHGNKLPYLKSIKVSFIKEEKAQLLEFKKGNMDMVYRLPMDMFDEIVQNGFELKGEYKTKNYQLQVTPSMAIQYYGFQNLTAPFDNKKVRQAFNYAIDRKKIVDYTLKGTGIAGLYGMVPPAFIGYDAKSIKGYDFEPDKARQLMKDAGYPGGKGFPAITLQITTGGGRYEQVAEAIDKMLEENLGITVEVSALQQPQHYDNIESGKAQFWRAGWRADYPDPEAFLTLLYSGHIPPTLSERSYLNSVRYKNPVFDQLFLKALSTVDETERNNLYLQADQVAIDDAPYMPIFYDKDYRLLQPYVKNLYQNPMEFRSFREVYFVPAETKKK